MTARFHVEPSDGDLILWDNADPARPREVAYQYGHLQHNVAVASEYGPLVWQVLTSVLAPDEATVERLARALSRAVGDFVFDGNDHGTGPDDYRAEARAVLAALRAPADQGGESS